MGTLGKQERERERVCVLAVVPLHFTAHCLLPPHQATLKREKETTTGLKRGRRGEATFKEIARSNLHSEGKERERETRD